MSEGFGRVEFDAELGEADAEVSWRTSLFPDAKVFTWRHIGYPV
jgi:hypothetical protein